MDPAGVLPNPCPGLLALRWSITICRGYGGSAFPAGLSHQPVVGYFDPPFITEPGDILAGGFARLLKYIAVSKPIPPQPMMATLFQPALCRAVHRDNSIPSDDRSVDGRSARHDPTGEDRFIESCN